MRPKEIKKIIEEARKKFEVDLKCEAYHKITANDQQLDKIISTSKTENGKSYLDIGTGNGYVAFELAKKYPQSKITGIDIAESVITVNNQKANQYGLKHLQFQSFQGKELPFSNKSFDGIFSRYSFHHFPMPLLSIQEIFRVTKDNGFCFITDPTIDEGDNTNFVNEYSKLRNDGHIKYYKEEELSEMFNRNGFRLESIFYDEISFPRISDDRYEALLNRTPVTIKEGYKIRRIENEVYITLKVMNVLFRKQDGLTHCC